MNDYKYHYLFTTFVSIVSNNHCLLTYVICQVYELTVIFRYQDIETFDLEDFKYNFVNMTAFRIVDAEDVGVKEILKDMEKFQPVGHSILNKSKIIQVTDDDVPHLLACIGNCRILLRLTTDAVK